MTAALACNCAALTSEEFARHSQLLEELRAHIVGIQALPDGYDLSFVGSQGRAVAEFVELERRACSFLTITAEPDLATVKLRVTGPDGAKPFLDERWSVVTAVMRIVSRINCC